LFPGIDAPVFSHEGGHISNDLELKMTAKSGTIYYTVDGSDPRASGGQMASNGVFSYNSPLKVNGNGTVKARVLDGKNWSALTEASFSFSDPTLILTAGFGTKAGAGNFPNPFNDETNIFFNLEKDSPVKVSVFNVEGKLVETIFEGRLKAGTQYQNWTPRGLEKGIYLYQVYTEGKTIAGKMVYLK
jgi:hypothetical protein